MKGLKIVALVLGGIVVLFAIGLILALTPAVQTWAVRKAMADQPNTQFHVSRVAAGFSTADIGEFRYVKNGIVITAKGVTARYSAFDYLTDKRINADAVNIDELVIDLRNVPSTAAAAGSATPSTPGSSPGAPRTVRPGEVQTPASAADRKAKFEGLLKQAELPFDLRLAQLKAKGRALLPNNQLVTFELDGSGIETAKLGKLQWTIDFADSTPDAALRGLRATGNAAVRINPERRIDLIEVETTVAAMGPKVSAEPIKLTAKAEKRPASNDESYSANVSLVRANAGDPIVQTNAQYVDARHEIVGDWRIALRTEQLAGLLAGLGLPELAASGSGKFSFQPDANTVSATGDLQAKATQLQKFMPELQAVGEIQVKTMFDGGLANNVARIDKLNLEIAAVDGRNFAQINSLQKIAYNLADKRVTLTDPKAELARISLNSLPLAWAQAFSKGAVIESGILSMVLAVEAEPDGSRVRTRAIDPFVIRDLTVRQGDKKVVDRVSISMRPNFDYSAAKVTAQIAELNVTTPAGDGVTGNVSADVTNLATKPAINFAAQLQGKIVTLLKAALPADTGPLSIATNVEGRHEGDILQVAKASATVNREGSVLLTALELQQPLRVDLKASTFVVANPNATAARIRIGAFPLAWAESFVAKSKFAGTFNGGVMDIAIRSMDDVTATTAEPLALQGVTATIDGKPQVQSLDLTANFTATKRGETITYDVRKLEAKQGQANLANVSLSGEATMKPKLRLAAKGNIDADVAALMKQPALAQFATLSRGQVTATFEAKVADATEGRLTISAKNLVAVQENRALGDIDFTLTADVKPDGSGNLSLPLTVTNANRKSDLTITGAFGKAANKETFLFTGKVASNQLVTDDFMPLVAFAPSDEKPKPSSAPIPSSVPKPSSAPKPTRDTAPFWKGINGKVEIDLKRVQYGKDYEISPVHGTAIVTDNKIILEKFEGRMNQDPFRVAGSLSFAAEQPQPYSLAGTADVQNFDFGKFLRAGNPNELPAFEAKATLSAQATGQAATVGDLAKNTFGKFELTGTEGVMRILARKGQLGTAVDVLSAGLAIFGAKKNSDTTVAVAEIAQLLKEVPFDRVKMQIERGADLKFKLTSMEVLSPTLRLTGSGTVDTKDAASIEKAPMNLVFQLGAKEQLAFLLQRVGMLGESTDQSGYNLMTRTFTVGGTPANADTTGLYKLLAEAALSGLGRDRERDRERERERER